MNRKVPTRWIAASFLGGFLLCTTEPAHAQSPQPDRNRKAGQAPDNKQAQTQANRRSAVAGEAQATGKAQPRAGDGARMAQGREFSQAYQESLRRTVEKRRELRSRRRAGSAAFQPPGAIVPWPMPPALIIRQTREVHGEVGSFLDVLRR
jgi:hypothetical protein